MWGKVDFIEIWINSLCLLTALPLTKAASISGPSSAYEGATVSWTCSGGYRYLWSSVSGLFGSTTSQTVAAYNVRRGSYSLQCYAYESDGDSAGNATTVFRVNYGPDSVNVGPSAVVTVNEGSTYGNSYPRCWSVGCDSCGVKWLQKTNYGILYSSSTSVHRTHDGSYTCEAWNIFYPQHKKTRNLRIIVHYGPDSVSTSPSNSLTLQEDYTYPDPLATCLVTGCNPSCSANWKKGSSVVSQGSGLSTGSSKVKRTFAGTYTCVGSNLVTRAADLNIVVNYPPDITASWNDVWRTLRCKVSGVPASYTFGFWRHVVSGVVIRQIVGNRIASDTIELVLYTPSYQDTGQYVCSVSNGLLSAGTDSLLVQETSQTVTINDKPVVVDYNKTHNASKGGSVAIPFELYATLQGIPTVFKSYDNGSTHMLPNTYYRYDNVWHTGSVSFYGLKAVVQTYTQTIHIRPVTEELFGNYTVRFKNQHGISEETFTLVPQGPPDTPTNLTVVNVTHESVILTFTSGFYNGARQTVVIEYKPTGTQTRWQTGVSVDAGVGARDNFSTTVSGLASQITYLFRAHAYNAFKRSQYTEAVTATTLKGTNSRSGIDWVAAVSAATAATVVIGVGIVLYRRRDISLRMFNTHTVFV